MNLVLLSIIPLLLIIGLILFILTVVKKSPIKAIVMNTKLITIIFAIYVSILFVGAILFFTLPTDHITYDEIDIDEFGEYFNEINYDYYELVQSGKFEESKSIVLNEEWEFEYKQPTIEIHSPEQYINIRVLIERKDENDGKIEAAYYTARTILNGLDITEKVEKHSFVVKDESIIIISPKPFELKMATFKKEFTITQFTGGDIFDSYRNHFTMRGDNILHLKIPNDLKVLEDNHIFIDYIKK